MYHSRLITRNKILYKSQYGFRKQKSTSLAIIEHVKETINSLDTHDSAVSVFIDLKKAFDAVDHGINDRIATQRYLTPEIPIGSPVMSRTTSEPSGGRSRKMVAIVAGCRSFRTFRDCHASIAFTTIGAQPNVALMFVQIWD